MQYLRYLPFVAALGAGLAFLGGAASHKGAQAVSTVPFSPPPAPLEDAAATQLFDAARAAFGPEHVSWLEMQVRQRVRLPELAFDAEGSFHSAPRHRFRLELHTHIGQVEGTFLAVSDGNTLWRGNRAGGEWTEVRRIGLRRLLDDANLSADRRNDFVRGPTFHGPESLLQNLRRRLVWVKRIDVTEDGKDYIELTGVWPAPPPMKNGVWPEGLPDRCRLLLEADTLWPRRFEWWGPTERGKRLTCLVELELSDPVFNRPLAPEQCVETFAFEAGKVAVIDETEAVGEVLLRK